MSATDQSREKEFSELKEIYDKVGLRGYWDIARTANRPQPIQPRIWHWRDVHPALERAAEVVRLGEDTFRRANGMDTGSRTLNAGFQYVAPGESAGAHRHTASALRFVVQGHGGYTTSDGVKMMMEPGDLLTQPNWTWHDHNNFGNEAMIWLDGLDAKLVQYLDAAFRQDWAEGDTQPLTGSSDDSPQNLFPLRSPSIKQATKRQPYRYPWTDTVKALDAEASLREPDPYDGYILEYTDPISGAHTLPTISCCIQMLAPGQVTKFHRHTATTIYHVVSGEGLVRIDKDDPVEFSWSEKDTFIVPPWRWHQHRNVSKNEPAYIFSESDVPVLESLGLHREEGD